MPLAVGGVEPEGAAADDFHHGLLSLDDPARVQRPMGARQRGDALSRPETPRYPVRSAVAVAQLVEPRVVVPVVAGSSPVRHPVLKAQGQESASADSCPREIPKGVRFAAAPAPVSLDQLVWD